MTETNGWYRDGKDAVGRLETKVDKLSDDVTEIKISIARHAWQSILITAVVTGVVMTVISQAMDLL